ncbi:MAG: PAS domain S-box protein [Candidatus Hodarchaeota archaeon]
MKESKNKYQDLYEEAPNAYFSISPDKSIIRCNKAAERLLGYSKEELLNMKVFDLYANTENGLQKAKRLFKRFLESKQIKDEELQFKHRNGDIIWISLSVNPIIDNNGNVLESRSMVIDISGRKKSEKKIADLARFPSENPNPVLRVDSEKILYINEAGKKLFNITEGKKIPYLLMEGVNSVISKNSTKIIEIGLNDRIYTFNITPIQEEKYINIYGIDITERIISEEALKNVKEFTDNILNTSIDTIFVFEPETGKAIRWNEAFRKVAGYTDDEIASLKAPDSYYSEEDLKKAAEATQKALSTGETTVEMSLITKEGRTIPFEYTGKTFRSFDGNLLIVAIGRDITERKKAEQKFKESEKRYREAYNRANFYKELIAHDMNNILQSIKSSVELYKLSKKRPEMFEDKKDFLSSITENVFRGSKLVSNVIKLSKLEETEMPLELVNINKNLMDAIVFIDEIYQNRNLHINVEAIEEDHYAIANELILDLFENILMNSVRHNINLVIEIQIRISEMQLENKKYCKIEFIDNGVGIHDERKVAIFQRRSNDENSTRGMGIGLSLVKQLIDSYNGKIWIDNRIKDDYKKGSNFIVLIPA